MYHLSQKPRFKMRALFPEFNQRQRIFSNPTGQPVFVAILN